MHPGHCTALPALLLVLGLAAATPARAQNLVTNGGFEDYDGLTVPSWTVSGNANQGGGTDTFLFGAPHSGSLAAWLGTPTSDGFLSQDIATTAGDAYTISFYLAVDTNGLTADVTPNDFLASFGGQTLLTKTDLSATDGHADSADDYALYTYTSVASGPASALTFGFRNDNSEFRLDDVSVLDRAPDGTAVPEPPTGALLGLGGLIGAFAVRRSRTTRSRS